MRKVLYLLGGLNDDDVEWLIANGQKQTVNQGATIIDEGKPTGALFIVLDGSFSAEVAALGGKEVERLLAGEIVGEMSFVDARPPSATVRAREASVVLAIPRRLLASKLEQEDGFTARFYKAIATFLSDRLRGKVEMLKEGGTMRIEMDEWAEDELDPNVLDSVYLAGTRFDRMLKRLAVH